MSRTDEEHAEFEQLTLSDFNMWSPAALKTFSNYSIIMASISNNIRNHVSGTVFPVANFDSIQQADLVNFMLLLNILRISKISF